MNPRFSCYFFYSFEFKKKIGSNCEVAIQIQYTYVCKVLPSVGTLEQYASTYKIDDAFLMDARCLYGFVDVALGFPFNETENRTSDGRSIKLLETI